MIKKSLITVLLICLIAFISSTVFATNAMNTTGNTLNGIKGGVQNMTNDAGNAMGDMKDGAENVVSGVGGAVKEAGQGVKNIVTDAGETAKDFVSSTKDDVANTVSDTTNRTMGTNFNTTDTRETTGNYTVARTSAADTYASSNSHLIIWTVLGIATAAIVALVWYYAAQINNDRD